MSGTRSRAGIGGVTAFTVLLLAVAIPGVAQGQTSADDAAVQQYFPQRLNDASRRDGWEAVRHSHYVNADLDNTGNPDYIVAAYTNGVQGALRVLKKQGRAVVLVADPVFPLMGGIFPLVSLRDLDGDRRPEIVVSLSQASASESSTWLFKWNAGAVGLLGPVEYPDLVTLGGEPVSAIGYVDYVDLDGDGFAELVGPAADDNASRDEDRDVFVLVGGTYIKASYRLSYYHAFARQAGPPITNAAAFSVKSPGTNYILVIASGDETGAGRVSSATITLNGVVVASPSMFNVAIRSLAIPIAVHATNSLTVRIAGGPGSLLRIGIRPR